MILFLLWQEEGLTQSQLADTLCVEAPTITKSLRRLEQAGLLERRQDGEDARISRVFLTPQGRALREPVQRVWDELEALTVQGLTDAEEALLRRALGRMSASLGASRPASRAEKDRDLP